jgi:hypothetical protein
MHFYFSIIAILGLKSREKVTRGKVFWILFNFLSSLLALIIAGARSRILLVAVVIALIIVMYVKSVMSSRQKRYMNIIMRKSIPLVLGIVCLCLLYGVLSGFTMSAIMRKFVVLAFLRDSFVHGDIRGRIIAAAMHSHIPDEVTLFGYGLGTIGIGGKPGEFGVRSMWIESGVVWGSLMLVCYLRVISTLLYQVWKAFLECDPLILAVFLTPALIIILALLTGLTSAFGLSSGILLCCSIGAAMQFSIPVRR